MTASSRDQQRAARFESRARNYQRQAQRMFGQDNDPDCAAILIYEAAKQCINAVANQHGLNPGPTGAKEDFLDSIAGHTGTPANLVSWWKSAAQLHIYADREHLSQTDYAEAWARAEAFIAYMLGLYVGRG